MIRKNRLIVFFLLTSILVFSCSQEIEEGITEASKTQKKTDNGSWVDSTTPKGVQPFKVNLSAKTANGGDDDIGGAEWYSVWTDEFNTNSLDTSKWIKSSENNRSVGANRKSNGIKRWYWDQDNINFNGTNLLLDVHKVGDSTLTGASVETRGKHEFKYGYYEVKVKIAETVKGTHTAFWLQGENQGNVDNSGRDGAEIDVFESVYQPNQKVQVAIHYDGYNTNIKGNVTIEYATPGIHDGTYHTFGMHWRKDYIDIYYDGSKVSSLNANKSFPISTDPDGDPVVPEVPEWLWLSTGAAFKPTNFASQSSGYLTTAMFDYVRVFKLKPKENTTFRIINKETDSWIKTFGDQDNSYIKQTNNSYGGWTRWEAQKIAGTDYYYIVNEGTGKFIRPIDNSNGSQIQLKPNSFTGSWTQWEFIDAGGDGYFYIKNKQTGKYLKPSGTGNAANSVVEYSDGSDWFKWRLKE